VLGRAQALSPQSLQWALYQQCSEALKYGRIHLMIKSRNLYICHFLPSCRDDKWLCRCKQHDLFPANTYQFFVKFPSLRESISVCACAANAIKALYTGWGILSATRGDECSDLCSCAWEGVICVKLVPPAVATGPCTTVYTTALLGL
jgi:hypothetical protein